MNKKIEKLYNILLSDIPSREIKKNEIFIFELIEELEKCKNFNQNNEWHIYDVYEHILHVVDYVDSNIYLRLSALFHDIGKPYTYTVDTNNVGHFYGHYKKSLEIFEEFSKKNDLDKKIYYIASKLIYYHDINISKLENKELLKFLNNFSYEELEMLFNLKISDLKAQNPKFHYLIKEIEKEKINVLNIKGGFYEK